MAITILSVCQNSALYDPPGDSLGTDYFVAKLDQDLRTRWFKKIGGTQVDVPRVFVFSADNNVFYLAGRTESNDGYVHG